MTTFQECDMKQFVFYRILEKKEINNVSHTTVHLKKDVILGFD
jgi:hypothetical protein